ncbi:CaiB/BaiF CoA transferase family protein [Paraburkholderia acidipaludis]|uniref:CaiB/BaiF CoA transferase family protein n=1 Tax=Paraburkholderia acidipaludis TaxID=660537 RepID=UPI0005B8A64D|nr:CoA transferase [Paraburkholderia acidipaludis]
MHPLPNDLDQPLAGVKVLELSQILAGPTCGLMLADLGAEVIKVERFPQGDDARRYRRQGDDGLPPSFMMLNRGKKSIALDIKHPAGREALLRLVAKSDILTENFRMGVMERLGLSCEALQEINPALVYCSITGYGRSGPLASRGGFDLILQAFAGLISVTGEEGGQPVKPGISVADVNAGILAAFGVLAAYVRRLRTGRGQRVDTSLLQASMQQLYWYAAAYFSRGIVPKPAGTAHPLIAPYQVYRCSDGGLAIGGANETNWNRIAQVLGHPEWIEDPRFNTPDVRLANRGELEVLINAILVTDTRAAWTERLEAAQVPCGPVQTVGEALDHEQSRAVRAVVEVPSPDGGTMRALGLPVLFDGTSHVAGAPAPRVGEDTSEVLRNFGFGADEIRALLASGAAHQSPVQASRAGSPAAAFAAATC